jgi:hypothetical protein
MSVCAARAAFQRLARTIRLMAEIDKVIEAHGGWPAAFLTKNADGPE